MVLLLQFIINLVGGMMIISSFNGEIDNGLMYVVGIVIVALGNYMLAKYYENK